MPVTGLRAADGNKYSICYSYAVAEAEWDVYQTDEVAAWMEDLRRSDPQAGEKVEAAVDVLRNMARRWGVPLWILSRPRQSRI